MLFSSIDIVRTNQNRRGCETVCTDERRSKSGEKRMREGSTTTASQRHFGRDEIFGARR